MAGGAALLGLAVAAGFFLPPGLTGQRAEAAKQGEDGPSAARPPLSQLVLFSSGVGYFPREGAVTGDPRVDPTFDAPPRATAAVSCSSRRSRASSTRR